MKFGLFTTSQSSSFLCQLLGWLDTENGVWEGFQFLPWCLASLSTVSQGRCELGHGKQSGHWQRSLDVLSSCTSLRLGRAQSSCRAPLKWTSSQWSSPKTSGRRALSSVPPHFPWSHIYQFMLQALLQTWLPPGAMGTLKAGIVFPFSHSSRFQPSSWHIVGSPRMPDKCGGAGGGMEWLHTSNIKEITISWMESNQDMGRSMWI